MDKNMSKILDEIFDSFTKESLFKNKFVLQNSYVPENLQHREEQIKTIVERQAALRRYL